MILQTLSSNNTGIIDTNGIQVLEYFKCHCRIAVGCQGKMTTSAKEWHVWARENAMILLQ